MILHIPESEGGRHIADDFAARGSYGLDPARVLFVPQTLFGGWRASGGKVAPIPGSRKFPYGHGYSSMQLVHPGSASALRDGSLRTIPDDPLASILREGRAIIRTHRVNDLTQVSPAILDIDRIAAGRLLLDRGHAVVIELVMNPTGQKGGNWVTTAGGHRFLVEGMNARADGWPEFMEKHRGAPYNAFRNLYDAEKLREILLEHPLPDHLRVRKLGGEGGARIGLYLESVTGDVTQAPRSRAAAFRLDEREEIHDLKELKDLAEGLRSIAAQDRDEDFRRVAAELGFTAG